MNAEQAKAIHHDLAAAQEALKARDVSLAIRLNRRASRQGKSQTRTEEEYHRLNRSDLDIHPDVRTAMQRIYAPTGLEASKMEAEAESRDYGAYTLDLNGLRLRIRVSRTTPTKTGQFVTLWKRIGNGPIQPFDWDDPIDFFVVICRSGEFFGQFVFPKSVLCDQGVVTRVDKGGKRALRVYPPWDRPISRQALKTQDWQLSYFLEASETQLLDESRVWALHGLDSRPTPNRNDAERP